ncbi:MAG: 3-keto-5-aminohexanoate cleavage protein, partial [Paracoccaceae bacterium]|nr:3-keto-5-aminohexanoate cleavage protein [Paracoccaceae bacterium]
MTAPFIMVAPNGARRMKTDHPELPITMQETVETAISCQNAGADALHLHIRDQQGQHSLDAGSYREALTELTRQVPNLRIQITTEAMGQFSVEDQFECLKNVQPEWASISIREIARSPDLAGKIYAACADQNTEVQHILYDTADVALFNNWRADDTIKTHQTSAIFVLGRYAQNQISRAS